MKGFGLNPINFYDSSSKKERRTTIVEKVREAEEERRTVKMTGLAKQGGHLRWEVPARKLSPRDLVMMPEDRFKFLVKAVYQLHKIRANGTGKKALVGSVEKTDP